MTTMYLAGPMRGKPCYNFQEFENATKWLVKEYDWSIVSPHEIDMETGRVRFEARIEWANNTPYRQFQTVTLAKGFDMLSTLNSDFNEILNCDGIIMLEGWQQSIGAVKELTIATWAGIPARGIHRMGPHHYRLSTLLASEETLAQLVAAHTRGMVVRAS